MRELDPITRVVLCRPEYFQLLPINEMARDYLRKGVSVDPETCMKEHEELAQAYISQGISVSYAEPDPQLTYQVFTRDPAFLTDLGLIKGRMFEPVRRREAEALAGSVTGAPAFSHQVEQEDAYLEGGDVAFLDSSTVAVGVGARTNQAGAAWLAGLLSPYDIRVVPVAFEPRYLHLDIIFTVAGPGVCLAVLSALPEGFLSLLGDLRFEVIQVTEDQALEDLACNVVATGNDAVISSAKSASVNARLRTLGLEIIEPGLDQLLKGGGGPRCLTLPIERRVPGEAGGLELG